MACGCGKRRSVNGPASSATTLPHQVWRNGVYTGRSFSSLFNAQAYAERIGGEVRSSS